MNKPANRLLLASVCCLLSASISTWLAIRQHLPAEFACLLHGENVSKDFFWKGTALSAPFLLLFAQLVLTGSLTRGGRIGKVSVRGLTMLGGCYTLGQLGEPIVCRVFKDDTVDLVPALLIVTNMSSSLAMVVFGIQAMKRCKNA